jgi:hypothetical protein
MEQQTKNSLLDMIMGGAKTVGNFVAPKATAAGSMAWNMPGLIGSAVDFNTAKDSKKKQEALKKYNEAFKKINEAQKQFGFDIEGDASKVGKGGHFNPVKFGTAVTEGATDMASIVAPGAKAATAAGRVGQRAAMNATAGLQKTRKRAG